jgi:hypothetical protein
MGKVDPSRFGSAAPKLSPDDIEDAAILTITAFDEVSVDDEEVEGGKRVSANLTFEETGDKVLWLNKGMVETLVEQLGDDSDDWIGSKVPVEAYTATFKGKKFPKVRVMPSEEWTKAFKEAGVRRVAAPVTRKKKAAKRGR